MPQQVVSTSPCGPVLRLRLKPKAEPTGYVDGAWWPRSRDLAEELAGLLRVLSVRLGPINRVVYGVSEWVPAPRHMLAGDCRVHLDWYRHQPPDTVDIIGVNRHRLTLAVIPPGMDFAAAHRAMMTAATPRNTTTAAELLADRTTGQAERARALEEDRWDSEGGALTPPVPRTLSASAGRMR
ncbi:MAG: DUF5994 family protein [Segniliparus sp.]|uniref:DUF5994 family protein n=1 Tax=Segniliparus sp. TaxID=2804064 RepID=UPI003F2FEFE9